ncbi:hypothetical protein RB595_002340 [Gaeumannomyces hyphopodioides]
MPGSTNPTHPELSSQLSPQGPKRKCGRQDYGRFDNRLFKTAPIGRALLRNVRVEVELQFAKSKWGFLRGYTPSGILFVNVNIHQQADCKLDWARVRIVLRDKEPDLSSTYPAQITHFFGPKHLTGPEVVEHKESDVQLQPSVQFMGTGVSGLGGSFRKKVEKVHHWVIRGERDSEPATGILGLHCYNKLQWDITENKLKDHRGSKVCTAFAFTHSGHEMLMDVIVEGRLSSKTDRFLEGARKLKFQPDARRKPGQISTTLIGVYSGERPPLDMLAERLEDDMSLANHISQPAKMPKPQQLSFRQKPAGHVPETRATLTSTEERPQEATSAPQQPQPLPESAITTGPTRDVKPLDPTAQRLFCAGQSLLRSPRDLILEEMFDHWDEANISSRSLSPTLVDGGRANETLKDELPEESDSFHSLADMEDKGKTETGPPHPLPSKPESVRMEENGLFEGRIIITERHLSILGAFAIGAVISYIMGMLK